MEGAAVASQQELNENPYVAVLSRKIRNLKKKYDRVVQLETQLKEGKKSLNEEQTILVASRPSLGKALAEIESIKKQLEEVAEQEKSKSASASPTAAANLEEPPAPETPQQQPTEMIDSSTFTQQVELVANSTQCEQQETSPSAASNVSTAGSNSLFQDPEVLKAHLQKILKLFHVCSRYTVLSGNPLPADINYFGKCLLGETSIDCFSKTLNQSVRNAELYLDEDLGAQYEAIRGMSYSQISDIIDSLAAELPLPAAAAPPRAPTPPPQSPQINFFADGGVVDAADNSKFQETSYNAPIGSFAAASSPFPLPPAAVVMYDQWNPSSEPSAPLSPSTLAASALGGVIGSTAAAPAVAQVGISEQAAVESTEDQTQGKDNNGKRGRGQSRGRGKGRGGRGRGKEVSAQSEGEVKTSVVEGQPTAQSAPSAVAEAASAAPAKGISWGGQQKKAGGALAVVSGATEATAAAPSGAPEKEAGRTSGRGRGGRGRGSSGRGGRGADASAASASDSAVAVAEGSRREGQGRGSTSRGRGAGRGSSRGGAGGRSGAAKASAPASTTAQA